MDFYSLIDEFYSKNVKTAESSLTNIEIIKHESFTEIDLSIFLKKFQSFLSLLVRYFNKGLGLKGTLQHNQKLIYKSQKSAKIISGLYQSFHEKIVKCEKCKLEYTYYKSPEIICTACGHVKRI